MTTTFEQWWGEEHVQMACLKVATQRLPTIFDPGSLMAGSLFTPRMPPAPAADGLTGPLDVWPTETGYIAKIKNEEDLALANPFVLIDVQDGQPADITDCGVDLFVVPVDLYYGCGIDAETYETAAAAEIMRSEALTGIRAVLRAMQEYVPGTARALSLTQDTPDDNGFGIYHVVVQRNPTVRAENQATDDEAGRDTMYALGYAQVGVHQMQRRPQAA